MQCERATQFTGDAGSQLPLWRIRRRMNTRLDLP
ncbi:hypothetical protein XFF6990_450069 [Xanthomonas citri pv. fuscans]|nr:hypothetical protein XFF6990_450069 [Xanthomonas citri pv. fuscans]